MKLPTLLIPSMMTLLVLSALGSSAHAARCSEDLANEKPARLAKAGGAGAMDATVEEQLEPLAQLQVIAREASKRSNAVGAAQLLADAAAYDLDETRGARWPQVTVSGGVTSSNSQLSGGVSSRQTVGTLALNAGASLYDGGRLKEMMQYRSGLLGSAKFGAAVTQEQVVLEAVYAALERNRYKLQAQVYQQYMRKMGCLVEALESIVSEDKGRASELVQVRKTAAQTEIQRDQALAQSRQSEFKLRKLVGDLTVSTEGISVPLATVPEIGEINRQIEFGSDAQQLRAQADAMDSYAKAVLAGQRPQVNWSIGKSQSLAKGNSVSSWQVGVSLNYTLFNGYSDEAAAQAANKRAQAARAQLSEMLTGKYMKTSEVWDMAFSAFDRAKRYVDVLRDSDKVRSYTFQQWSQIGKRSLFDVMSTESEHFNLRIAYVNALYDGYEASAQLRSMGAGLSAWLVPEQR
jgi:adhesin transport system outer membrane protein